jgi:hypothetical protein
MLLAIPFIIILAVKKQYYKVIAVFTAAILSFGTSRIDNNAYNKSPEYKEYREFNKLRSKITSSDNPNITYPNKKHIADKLGWTISDFFVATSFNLDVGHPKFSKEKLLQLVDEPKSVFKKSFSKEFLAQLKTTSLRLIDYLNNKYYYIFYFILVIMIYEKRWKELIWVASLLFYILFIAFVVHYYYEGQLKPRILYSLVLPFLFLIVYLLDLNYLNQRLTKINSKMVPLVFVIISLSIVFLPFKKIVEQDRTNTTMIEEGEKIMDLILNEQQAFYVSWVFPKFNIFDLSYDKSNAYQLGWVAGSPSNKSKIEAYTGKKNIGVYSIFNKDIVWYYLNDEFHRSFSIMIKIFYENNYKDCSFKREHTYISKDRLVIKETFFINKP